MLQKFIFFCRKALKSKQNKVMGISFDFSKLYFITKLKLSLKAL